MKKTYYDKNIERMLKSKYLIIFYALYQTDVAVRSVRTTDKIKSIEILQTRLQ